LYLLVLEFLGTNELLVILVVALILLGPRRLPGMSRKLGKSLAEFKRASEDFKRTWEREVEMEMADKDARIERALPSPQESESILDATVGRSSSNNFETSSHVTSVSGQNFAGDEAEAVSDNVPAPSVTPVDPSSIQQPATTTPVEVAAPTRKRDWL
jgi:Sec-independent protein secretion pathway components